ncbi:twin-arginine translocase subunit TatC [soil metagenome]
MSAFEDDTEIEGSRAPLLTHLVELRSRLIVCVAALAVGFILCFIFSQQIYIVLLRPFQMAAALLAAQKAGGNHGPFDLLLAITGFKALPPNATAIKLVFTAPLEFFFTKMKLAGFGAVVCCFPILAWQLYRFVAPGLYRRERKAFFPFLMAAPVLFCMGAALVYYIMLPFVLWFSLSQQITGGDVQVELLPKVSDYLDLVTKLLLAFGLCFQLPVVLSLVGLAGLVSSEQLGKFRRYAIVAIVFVAALITPPDPVSQMLLAIPIYLLYEASILCVKLIERGRKADESRELVVP